jgi:hypothetical protein
MVTESGHSCTAGNLNRGAVLQHGLVGSARLVHFWRSLVALQFAWVDNLKQLYLRLCNVVSASNANQTCCSTSGVLV